MKLKKYIFNSKGKMNKSFTIKLSLLILMILAFGTQGCFAYFSDEENNNSTLGVGVLDFYLNENNSFGVALTPSQGNSQDIFINNEGNLDFNYEILSGNSSGELCDYVILNATLDGIQKYNGPLKDFYLDLQEYTNPSTWHFDFSLNTADSSIQQKQCDFKFVLNGWQLGCPKNSGFIDSEEVMNTIISGTWQDAWIQTTEPDYSAGAGTNIDINSYPGDVVLPIDGSGSTNLSSGATATAISSDSSHLPSLAIDGDVGTYWHADGSVNSSGPWWYQVDLGTSSLINKVVVLFTTPKPQTGADFDIQLSNDNFVSDIRIAQSVTGNNSSGPLTYTFSPESARYVRIYITANAQGNGVPAIKEFEVYPVQYSLSDGVLISQTIPDEGKILDWQSLYWTENAPMGTDISLEVSTSNNASDWSAWQLLSNSSPIDLSNLPDSRFIRWRATLSTIDGASTPALKEVGISYLLSTASQDIVLNEFLPNPTGDECSLTGINGEWVELYNKGDDYIDLSGWQIKDQGNIHIISITNSNTLGGSTIIGPNDWLVVFLNDCVLNNTGDSLSLYDIIGNQIDSYTYDLSGACSLTPTPGSGNTDDSSGDCSTEVPENKSYARIPDGTGSWVDPIPTPGCANVLISEDVQEVDSVDISEEDVFISKEDQEQVVNNEEDDEEI